MSSSTFPKQKNFDDTLIVSVLPSKSITIGTLRLSSVDKTRTASLVGWAVVVVSIVVVVAGSQIGFSHPWHPA